MTLTVTIVCDNAAFDADTDRSAPEVARILRLLAERLEHYGTPHPAGPYALLDDNGNRVGAATVTL